MPPPTAAQKNCIKSSLELGLGFRAGLHVEHQNMKSTYGRVSDVGPFSGTLNIVRVGLRALCVLSNLTMAMEG